MLNFFNDVAPNVIPVGDDEIDILFDVDEKEVGQANFSMGIQVFKVVVGSNSPIF